MTTDDLGISSARESRRSCVLKQVGEDFSAVATLLTRCFLLQEDETKPEDCIPDVPGNEHAREFLAHAPTRGLWMPLGKEVKVMQCECGRASSNTPEYTQVTYHNLQSALIFELSRSHHSAVQGVV